MLARAYESCVLILRQISSANHIQARWICSSSSLSLLSSLSSAYSFQRSLELFYTRLRGRSIATTLSRRGGRKAPRKSRRLKSTRHFHIDSVVCVGSTRSRRRDPFSARKSHRVPSPSIPRSFDRENVSPELRVKTRRKFPSPPKSSPRRDKKKNVYVAIAFASRAESTSRDLSETRERNCWDGFLQSFAKRFILLFLKKRCSFSCYPIYLNHRFLLRNQA